MIEISDSQRQEQRRGLKILKDLDQSQCYCESISCPGSFQASKLLRGSEAFQIPSIIRLRMTGKMYKLPSLEAEQSLTKSNTCTVYSRER